MSGSLIALGGKGFNKDCAEADYRLHLKAKGIAKVILALFQSESLSLAFAIIE